MKGQPIAILAAIEQGAHRSREISKRTGIPLEQVQVRLAELKKLGAVVTDPVRNSGPWAPKTYRLNTASGMA